MIIHSSCYLRTWRIIKIRITNYKETFNIGGVKWDKIICLQKWYVLIRI